MPEGAIRIWKKAASLALAIAAGAAAAAQATTQDPAPFEVVALLEQAPGNVAVTADGRIIVSQHQFYDPVYRVVEVLGDGSTQPFPNQAWAGAPGPDGRGILHSSASRLSPPPSSAANGEAASPVNPI